jgi:hypothetical protein
MIRRLPSALVSVGIILVCVTAHAQSTEVADPRSMAMGESLRADATGSLAISLNPSGLPLSHGYQLEGTFGYRPTDHANVETASICDSVTSRVAACLYYQHIGSSANTDLGEPDITFNEAGLTLGTPIGQAITFGVTQKYSALSESVPAGTTDNSHSGFGMDAGLTLRPGPALNLGAVMYNIYGSDSAHYSRALGFGFALNLAGALVIAGDTRYDLERDSGRWGGGVEYTMGTDSGQGFPLRIGYVYDAANSGSYLTGGLGYTTPRVGIEGALRKQVSNGDEFMFVFALKLYLPS